MHTDVIKVRAAAGMLITSCHALLTRGECRQMPLRTLCGPRGASPAAGEERGSPDTEPQRGRRAERGEETEPRTDRGQQAGRRRVSSADQLPNLSPGRHSQPLELSFL